jgi:2-hydroxy-palmitic acid dioxygenase Mpo1-like protein
MREHESLLAWQWRIYSEAHRDRRNLATHLATQPIFVAGALALLAAPLAPWLLVAGPAAMVMAMAAQGRGHKGEETPPAPFRGPLDVVARIFAEQLVTFPRYVLSGGWARAWRASDQRASAADAQRANRP